MTANASEVWAAVATYLARRIRGIDHEAGTKLRSNPHEVLKDVCNPSKDKNIDGKPLTQLNLVRVDPKDEALAGEALCEIERRLLWGEGWSDAPNERSQASMENGDSSTWTAASVDAWREGRTQSQI